MCSKGRWRRRNYRIFLIGWHRWIAGDAATHELMTPEKLTIYGLRRRTHKTQSLRRRATKYVWRRETNVTEENTYPHAHTHNTLLSCRAIATETNFRNTSNDETICFPLNSTVRLWVVDCIQFFSVFFPFVFGFKFDLFLFLFWPICYCRGRDDSFSDAWFMST